MTQPRKRGRPAKVTPEQAETRLKVLKADTIHDGEGGFLPVGALFVAVEPDALIARGFAE